MTGHVRFHKGSWNVVLFQGRRINSKGKLADSYHWISGFGTEREAHEELTRQLSAKLEGSYVEPHKMTVEQYLRHWLTVAETATTPKTFQEYEGICRRYLIPALGPIHLVKLTPFDVEGFYAQALRKGGKNGTGLSPRTVIHCHRLLHKAFRDAVKKHVLAYSVIAAATPPQPRYREMQAPDERAMAYILIEAGRNQLIWVAVLIACGSGLRRGEVLALRGRDVDLATGACHVERSLSQTKKHGLIFKDVKKKKSRRKVTLPRFVLEGLHEELVKQQKHRELLGTDYQDNGLICCYPDGRPIEPNRLSDNFAAFRERLGLKFRFHDMRHGNASQQLRDGVPLKTVSARLGHATAAFTLDVYGHLLPGDDERAADSVQRNLGAELQKQRSEQRSKPVN